MPSSTWLPSRTGRAGIRTCYDRLNAISDETPVLVDLKPVGEGYMEDFFAAGGVAAVLQELKPLLHLDTMTVDGRNLGEILKTPPAWVDRKVVREFANPVSQVGGPDHASGIAGAGWCHLQARRRHRNPVRT